MTIRRILESTGVISKPSAQASVNPPNFMEHSPKAKELAGIVTLHGSTVATLLRSDELKDSNRPA